jgi:hypothetical protein
MSITKLQSESLVRRALAEYLCYPTSAAPEAYGLDGESRSCEWLRQNVPPKHWYEASLRVVELDYLLRLEQLGKHLFVAGLRDHIRGLTARDESEEVALAQLCWALDMARLDHEHQRAQRHRILSPSATPDDERLLVALRRGDAYLAGVRGAMGRIVDALLCDEPALGGGASAPPAAATPAIGTKSKRKIDRRPDVEGVGERPVAVELVGRAVCMFPGLLEGDGRGIKNLESAD